MYNDDMRFVESHEWVKIVEGDLVMVGITNHAQELLGDLVYVELPVVGKNITKHGTIGVVESVKAASDLYAPISGIVTEINEAVVSDPTLANSDPHGAGWLFKAKLDNMAQLDQLMSAKDYASLINA